MAPPPPVSVEREEAGDQRMLDSPDTGDTEIPGLLPSSYREFFRRNKKLKRMFSRVGKEYLATPLALHSLVVLREVPYSTSRVLSDDPPTSRKEPVCGTLTSSPPNLSFHPISSSSPRVPPESSDGRTNLPLHRLAYTRPLMVVPLYMNKWKEILEYLSLKFWIDSSRTSTESPMDPSTPRSILRWSVYWDFSKNYWDL